MSYVVTAPEALRRAAAKVRQLRQRAVDVNAESETPAITAVVAPALDDDSERVATYLVRYGKQYRQTIAAAAAILEEFAVALDAGAAKYSAAEVDNITALSYRP
ncbi:PE family protein [Mycobacterium haemophilum]|uniref:PE family protein n=1 Tax=Mycobacterium haemophilum TaxID=29311 RepID=A0A0I9T8Y9_9MYCO|nr:PE family protein [Mycobacterium haemophilum]KLO25639.1 PE family protein [Mycobacterium haemophilum]KLO38370.1 PE family protein [Mycobacterium haemophilum]KLO39400.1 PE family protein [Mycobacterium haemophilum]KLO46221.1 PE family protein [Mycobacterium haemophilum]